MWYCFCKNETSVKVKRRFWTERSSWYRGTHPFRSVFAAIITWLTVLLNMSNNWPRVCSNCRRQGTIFFSYFWQQPNWIYNAYGNNNECYIWSMTCIPISVHSRVLVGLALLCLMFSKKCFVDCWLSFNDFTILL